MKRTYVILSVILVCAICLAACQPTPDTPPVVSKNDGTLENAISDGAGDGYVYTAPETYSETLDFHDGKLSVIFDEDTQIKALEGIQYPVYEVTVQNFDRETVEKVSSAFFGDAQLESHISIEQRMTKPYILNELILPKKVKLADLEHGLYDKYFFEDEKGIYELNSDGEKVHYDDSDKTMEEIVADEIESLKFLISSLEKDYENAPVNEPKSSPISLNDYNGGTLNADIMLPDGRIGRLCIYDHVLTATCDYNVNNSYTHSDIDENHGAVTGTIGDPVSSEEDVRNQAVLYNMHKEVTCHLAESLDLDKIKTQAEEFVKSLGLDDSYVFAAMGTNGIGTTKTETDSAVDIQYNSVGVCFMRAVDDSMCIVDDGIYSVDDIGGMYGTIDENGQIKMDNYSEEFRYEKLVLWLDSEGVKSIYWSSPLKIERRLQSSVEIVPLETAFQNAAQSLQRTESLYDGLIHKDITFKQFELGHTMMLEKNKTGYFILIPTWIGTYRISGEHYDDDNETVTNINERINTIAVNALDGSIIDRYMGY